MNANLPAETRRTGAIRIAGRSLMSQLSIRHKLVLIIMTVSAFSMMLTSGALIVYQDSSFRERMARDLETQAQMLATNCAGALLFDDPDDAEEVLASLRAKTPILVAGVYRGDKTLLASYRRTADSVPPRAPDGEGHRFGDDHVVLVKRVILDEQTIGTIYLRSDLSELTAFRRESLLALALMVLLASIVAYVLSSRVQRVISGPIFELARTARAVTEDEDYSIRARRDSEDELGLLTDAFNNMLAHVEKTVTLEKRLRESQKMEAIGRLAGGIAHDFNNLLQVISSHLHFVRQAVSPQEVSGDDVEGISKATESATALTQQLLAFSRQAVTHPESLDLNRVAGEAVTMVRRTIGEDIEASFSPGTDLWPIRADAGQVQQVILNLALNARDAMPGGGKLSFANGNVSLSESDCRLEPQATPGDYVMLSVADTGCGMDEHTKAHALEPFFTTKSAGRGTGLGLATVFGIVNQTGGHLAIDSEVGKGTTVRVCFPRSEETPSASVDRRLETTDRGGRGELLLLVEDEQAVRKTTSRVLRHAGYHVLEAGDAEEAGSLFAVAGHDVALLITDVVMPGRRGDELAQDLLRKNPRLAVLFITGYAPRAGSVALEGGACLQKPIDPDVLLRKIGSLLDERSSGAWKEPSAGGLLLLVEDEPAIRRATRHMLVQVGYEVVLAEDGREGLECFEAQAEEFEAVILDWLMPGMGGEETLRRMLEIRPGLRAVITSGGNASETWHETTAAIAFLQKPFDRDQLIDKLEEVGSSFGKRREERWQT